MANRSLRNNTNLNVDANYAYDSLEEFLQENLSP